MKVYKFETIYPRVLWVVNASDKDPTKLTKRFTFYKNIPPWEEVDDGVLDELKSSKRLAIAGCYIVQEIDTGLNGLLLILFDIVEVDTSIVAHESVHVADYFYEVSGCNSEDYSEGNEAYAYLVGWVAGCISNVLIKERNGKTE